MTSELWRRLKPLYHAALDLSEKERAGYVEQVCGDDSVLGRELQALLAADQSASDTLNSPFAVISASLRSRPVFLPPGAVLAGRFRIVRHLGSGGMGDVYEALDQHLEAGRVALKTLRPAIARDAAALARFKDEVRIARQVTGPNVCRIYELYVTESPEEEHCPAFLTMELLEGVTLHERIVDASPLPAETLRPIAEQLCAALCCIHDAGIVHRDLKPGNVMLVSQVAGERAVVMDFGLARATAMTLGSTGESQAGPAVVAGTPSYMAPEQFEGGEVTPATDIYALGLILYELATGVQPFAAASPLAAAVRRGRRPESVSSLRTDLPPGWDEVISKCLQYDPAQRYASATEVAHALKHPQKVVWHLGAQRRLAISRRWLTTVSVLAVLVVAAAAWSLVRSANQRHLTPEVAHWYAMGIAALREGSYLKATRLLSEVTRRDPGYALAHAALADAWTELDFTEAAQHEMLLATSPLEERWLSEAEKRYIDAVRTTLVPDYPAAEQDYREILNMLPQESKAQGYVDLGRIYDKAGKLKETLASYEEAAKLNPDDPAPFLHLGILKSRLRNPDEAEQAFAKAESLYRAESDLEGLAEVAYQRGHAASESGSYARAKQYINQSLEIARQIPSVQLEIRSLSQLSVIAYRESADDQAIEYADEMRQLAGENGLEYWATDAFIRIANATMDKGDYVAAENAAQEALRRAKQNQHPREEAFAELTLASLRSQQHRSDEQIAFAQSALHYFQDHGFLNSQDQAATLILRGERDKGDLQGALSAATQLLNIAHTTRSTLYIALAEESIGNVLLRLERYPDALSHLHHSIDELRQLGQDPAYQQVQAAEAAWQLGRYAEATETLNAITPTMRQRGDIGVAIAATAAEMKLSQGQLEAALVTAQEALKRIPGAYTSSLYLDRIAILAQAQMGQVRRAQVELGQLANAIESAKGDDRARMELACAQVALASGDPHGAQSHARIAGAFFLGKDMEDSTAVALAVEAQASQRLGDNQAAASSSQRAVDVLRKLRENWSVPVFAQYALRPDRRQTLQALAKLRGESGDVPRELVQ